MKLTIIFHLVLLMASQASAADGWHGDNHEKIRAMIGLHGRVGAQYSPKAKPVAVFDWDNTVIKNDVGDATLFWMLANDKVRKPTDWSRTSAFLTPAAVEHLRLQCGKLPDSLPTSHHPECADAILAIYTEGRVAGSGVPAWSGTQNLDTIEPAYAWGVQLMAGYTPGEIAKFGEEVIRLNLARPLHATQKIGSKSYGASIRIYEPMKNLISELQGAGFEVWISSASAQPVVEVFARRVGIAADHVIGGRASLDSAKRQTAAFEGCGIHPSGNQSLINYRQGKRCWINKVIFGEKNPEKMMNQPSPTVFAAGDSDTDIFFLRDAQALRLAINRSKPELMCHAYENRDGKWIVNPMFTEPKSRKTEGHDCSRFGIAPQKDGN